MNYRGVGVVVAALILTACGGSSSSGPEPLSIEEYTSELIEVSDPINQFCLVLGVQAEADDTLPPLLNCNRDTSIPGKTAIMMVWGDPVENSVENDIGGEEWPIASEIAAAELFASAEENLTDVDVLFFAFRDRCNNTVEMPVAVALQLGKGELEPMAAMAKTEIYGDANC